MEKTIGKRIAALRKEKGLKQEDVARSLDVSSQAVSKWENDQSYPDISLLPKLAKLLGVSVDALLSGEEEKATVKFVPEEKRKDISEMVLRIQIDTDEGDKVRISVPMVLLQLAIETGVEVVAISGNTAIQKIDWVSIIGLVQQGVVGNLFEIESDEARICVFVE